MKRLLSLLLLISAVVSLVGQEAAFANVVPVEQSARVVAAPEMNSDCAELMGINKQPVQSDVPCRGMTPDCIAKMGCTAVAFVAAPQVNIIAPFVDVALPPSRAKIAALTSRETGPEPHPPSTFG